jgi:hypothetical protein
VPTFCRHNRLIQHCPICAREQQIELVPVISSSAPRTAGPRTPAKERRPGGDRAAAARERAGVRVRRLERGADDGYRSSLALGLRSSMDAQRLAQELAFAATRLRLLSERPPGLYAEVAAPGDIEERTWLAFLIAYLCPLDDEDPFASVRGVRTPWASAESPDLRAARTGPRTAHDPARGPRTVEAYVNWAGRAGSQAAAFMGDPAWTPERRFARVFERLALPGMHRDARFELLVSLGCLRLFELSPGELMLGGSDAVTVAAKRIFGIGERYVLEGRAAALAAACELPLAALDLALYNWQQGERVSLGVGGTEPDPQILARVREGLEL